MPAIDISQNESYWDATDCISPVCNRCGKSPLYYAEVAHVRWDLRHLPKFCSNCGATMKEVLYSDKSGKVQKLQILKRVLPGRGGYRSLYYCDHENQQFIRDYFKEHRLIKQPGFLCFGNWHSGCDEPTIKTSPVWCPLYWKKEE